MNHFGDNSIVKIASRPLLWDILGAKCAFYQPSRCFHACVVVDHLQYHFHAIWHPQICSCVEKDELPKKLV